jgi:hypothetical protein
MAVFDTESYLNCILVLVLLDNNETSLDMVDMGNLLMLKFDVTGLGKTESGVIYPNPSTFTFEGSKVPYH